MLQCRRYFIRVDVLGHAAIHGIFQHGKRRGDFAPMIGHASVYLKIYSVVNSEGHLRLRFRPVIKSSGMASHQHKKARRKPATKAAPIPPAELRCEWCGNLIAGHSKDILASCRDHMRQLFATSRMLKNHLAVPKNQSDHPGSPPRSLRERRVGLRAEASPAFGRSPISMRSPPIPFLRS